jgi:prephenate dehydrogenase
LADCYNPFVAPSTDFSARMKIDTLTIVGVGLIGGSIGLAAKQRGLARRVLGVGHRQSSLDQAVARGAVDEISLNHLEAVPRADVAVFCTPVDLIGEQILSAAPLCKPGTLVTDAGSTKAELVRTIEGRLPPNIHFVGSHPLAGSEKRGSEHARGDLFEGKLTIVTQTAETDGGTLDRTVEFWQALGSQVVVMDPEAHDRALALTSHLPHLVASALVSILTPRASELTASGFRDTTRIAAGDASLWTGILLQNREPLLAALDRLDASLAQFRHALETLDRPTLNHLLTQAKRIRDALD